MNIQVNEGIRVVLEAASRLFIEKKIFIQWKEEKKNDAGIWETDSPNSIVALLVEDEAYEEYIIKSDAERQLIYTGFLENYYAV